MEKNGNWQGPANQVGMGDVTGGDESKWSISKQRHQWPNRSIQGIWPAGLGHQILLVLTAPVASCSCRIQALLYQIRRVEFLAQKIGASEGEGPGSQAEHQMGGSQPWGCCLVGRWD